MAEELAEEIVTEWLTEGGLLALGMRLKSSCVIQVTSAPVSYSQLVSIPWVFMEIKGRKEAIASVA